MPTTGYFSGLMANIRRERQQETLKETGAARLIRTEQSLRPKRCIAERRNADYVRKCIRDAPSTGATQLYALPIILYPVARWSVENCCRRSDFCSLLSYSKSVRPVDAGQVFQITESNLSDFVNYCNTPRPSSSLFLHTVWSAGYTAP